MAVESDRLWAGSMPQAYDQWLAPAVFRPFARDLARRAARLDPRQVLELAAGTGVLTRELLVAGPAAQVTATDLNTAMTEYGARQVPAADWRQADALDLPFPAGQFDVVACQFGVMFFPDKPAAFSEARRVLAPGGQLIVSTWDRVETHGFAAALTTAVQRVFPEDPPDFVTAVPHGYADPDQAIADLARGGLECVSAESVTLTGHADSAAGVATGFCTGTPLRMAIESRGDLATATADISAEMTALLGDGPVTAAMTAYVIQARPRAAGVSA